MRFYKIKSFLSISETKVREVISNPDFGNLDKNDRPYAVMAVQYFHNFNNTLVPEGETKRKKVYQPDGEFTLELDVLYAERETVVAATNSASLPD